MASMIHKPDSVRDPVARARRTTLIVGSACGLFAGLALTWCFWPVGVEEHARSSESSSLNPASTLTASMAWPVDLAAFEAPLWTAPPPPPPPIRVIAATPTLPPPPPLKLQLLGIFQVETSDSASSYRALLYDPDQDKVVIVASGDSIAQRTVDFIDRGSIALRDTAGVRTIALRPDQSTSVPFSPTEVRR